MKRLAILLFTIILSVFMWSCSGGSSKSSESSNEEANDPTTAIIEVQRKAMEAAGVPEEAIKEMEKKVREEAEKKTAAEEVEVENEEK